MQLPGGYFFWDDDKYWHTAILNSKSIVVHYKVMDHVVVQDYILAVRLEPDPKSPPQYC